MGHRESLMEAQHDQASAGGEPVIRERKASPNNGGVRVSLPKFGSDRLGIEPGDELQVEYHGDHFRIAPKE